MKTNEELLKNVYDETKLESLTKAEGISVATIVKKHMKRFIYATSLIGVGLLFNSCLGGYIVDEPTYVEVSRPPQPTNYIWIDGDWTWSSQNHNYIHNNGYWAEPRQNRTYVSGYWQTSSRGRQWAPGHWQRNGRNGNQRHR